MKVKPIKGIIKNHVFSVKISNHAFGLPLGEDKNYMVFNDGTVYSEKSRKYLKPGNDSKGYLFYGICTNGKSKSQKAHRLVAKTHIPNFNNYPQIDHIDRDRQNNHVSNLRWCTNQMNHMNRSAKKSSTSKFVGVYWNTAAKKWHSSLGINGKVKYLGLFDDELKAHQAYLTAKEKYHKM
ncbi:HNH endonuclease [Hymenobacter aerilatus]|uniref:HNH endonuclease n=1 Tax=Hymenobacter aerilatus TaxID=2932251 RepID=A0A8T9SYP5_9BACT|nr:HNH endonuclease [Hymenobacter aerilatus]UOR05853.1 HNH endonuclease [Hymenobacter aerilatus]